MRLASIVVGCLSISDRVHATPVQVDFRGEIGRSTWTNGAWAGSGEFAGTLLLDTSADSFSSTSHLRNSDSAMVVDAFRFSGVHVLRMSAAFGSNVLFDLGAANALSHSFSGEAPGLALYESFLGGSSVAAGYQFELPLTVVATATAFASYADPMLALLTAGPVRGSGTLSGRGDFGSFGGSLTYLSIKEIPEPATLGMMILGLAACAAMGWRSRQCS